MLELFRNRSFLKLFLASFASQMGSTIGNMAFAFYLLDRFSKQPFYASLAEMMYALPTLFVFFIVGVVADRFDRKRIAEYTGWIRAVLTVGLIGSLLLNWLPAVFALLFIRGAVSKFFAPAETALLQGVLDGEQFIRAVGLNQMIFSVFMLFGVGLGALAYSTIGIVGAVMIDGLGFIISALLIRMCRIDREVRLPSGETTWKEVRLSLVWADFREGFLYVRNNRLLLALIGGFLLFGLMNGGFAVLPMFTMKYKLAPDQYEKFASLFAMFLGVGFFIGSLASNALIKRYKPHKVILFSLLACSILIVGLGLISSSPWLYLVLVLIAGLFAAPMNIAIGGWLPQIVEPSKMGRVSAWIDPALMLGQSVSLGFISVLYPGTLSLTFLYTAVAVAMAAAFLFYLFTLPRLSKQAQWTAGVETEMDLLAKESESNQPNKNTA